MTSYVAGLYQRPMAAGGEAAAGKACLYVNRGLGTIGIPVRLGAQPEISLLTLHSA